MSEFICPSVCLHLFLSRSRFLLALGRCPFIIRLRKEEKNVFIRAHLSTVIRSYFFRPFVPRPRHSLFVAGSATYKSPCRSVRRSVTLCCPSHFAFFVFFGFLEVGKHIFQFLLSNKQHLQSLFLDQSVNKSFCWLDGLSVDWLKFLCFHIFRFVWCKTIMN